MFSYAITRRALSLLRAGVRNALMLGWLLLEVLIVPGLGFALLIHLPARVDSELAFCLAAATLILETTAGWRVRSAVRRGMGGGAGCW